MAPVRPALFMIGGLLLGVARTLPAQAIAVDSGSRGGAAALGFLAGAGAGLVIAHFVNVNKRTGEGKLENYLGIPLGLGVFTAATVFVAMGD